MDIYVARQPIFDRNMNLFGYELLYRESNENFFKSTSDNKATASLLANSFLVIDFDELINGTHGFINFPEEFLIQELPRMLPSKKIIVEILERVLPSREVIKACRSLKKDGYILALDDFVFGRKGYEELIDLADMIKLEFSRAKIKDQMRLIQKYKGKKTFLAEKVETVLDYRFAYSMGYDLFQGYFFSKPMMVNAKEIDYHQTGLIRIYKELSTKDPDLDNIAKLIEADLGLTYKLLRAANTIQYGTKYPVKSVRQALARIGVKEMMNWIQIMMIKGVQKIENAELIRQSLIRGKMLELIAQHEGKAGNGSDYFIAGIFSSLDLILNQPMDDIVSKLPLDTDVRNALLGKNNELKKHLDAVVSFERAQWDKVSLFIQRKNFTNEQFMSFYLKAIRWEHELSQVVDTSDK